MQFRHRTCLLCRIAETSLCLFAAYTSKLQQNRPFWGRSDGERNRSAVMPSPGLKARLSQRENVVHIPFTERDDFSTRKGPLPQTNRRLSRLRVVALHTSISEILGGEEIVSQKDLSAFQNPRCAALGNPTRERGTDI
jgi:hypothetical protein